MAKEIDFSTGTIVSSDFLDNQQEVESSLAFGVRVVKTGNATVTIPIAADGSTQGSTSVRINGLPRFNLAPVSTNLSGLAAGTYNVYVVAGAGPGFTVGVATGAGPANSRKVGEVVWDGTSITAVRNMVDAVSGHAHLHRPGGEDALDFTVINLASTAATRPAASAANAGLFHFATDTKELSRSTGTTWETVTANSTPGDFTVGRQLLIPTAGTTGGIVLGGDVVLYRQAADRLQTDDLFAVKRGASGDYTLAVLVTGDTALRWQMQATGRMEWGSGAAAADVNLFRQAADILATDDQFRTHRAAASAAITNLLTSADGNPSFRILGSGEHGWGAGGNSALDTNLYRDAADVLKTDDTFDALAYRQGGTALPVVIHAQGTLAARPAAAAANSGFLYYATDEQVLYRSDGTAWAAWAGGGAGRFVAQVGDGTSTTINVDHNLATRNAVVYVFESSGLYRQVLPEVQHTSTNRVTLLFDVAPASGEYTVVVLSAATATTSATGVGSHTATIGNGVATAITVNHNLGTRAVNVQVREAASPFAVVEPDIEISDPNFVTLRFSVAPATNQYVVTVLSGANPTGAASQHRTQHAVGGSDALSARVQREVLVTGVAGQTRAGRSLTLADFTDMGLRAPIGLYKLGDVNDSSGNARPLTNRGGVTFGVGVEGVGGDGASVHDGTATSVLYQQANESAFQIRTGSFGCWFRTGHTGARALIGKELSGTSGDWLLYVNNDGTVSAYVNNVSGTGWSAASGSLTALNDNRWHFAVVTIDGNNLRLYIDGALENSSTFAGVLPVSTNPVNIGGRGGNAGTAPIDVFQGRIDEAFVTADVLSEDQIRMLYAARVPHGLTLPPVQADVSVRRRRRGAALAQADFPSPPLRLYNLQDPNLVTGTYNADLGTQGRTLNPSGGVAVAGPDGGFRGALALNLTGGTNDHYNATDSDLPAGASARSMGAWFLTRGNPSASYAIMAYGTLAAGVLLYIQGDGEVVFFEAQPNLATTSPSTVRVNDGQWHHAAVVLDPSPLDGQRTKLYVDGRLVARRDNALGNTAVLGTADAFRIGRNRDTATNYFVGAISRVFVTNYAMDALEVMSIYAKGSQLLSASPKSAGEHVEGFDATNLLVIGDTLEPQHRMDLAVSA